jgi:hypothetical protein
MGSGRSKPEQCAQPSSGGETEEEGDTDSEHLHLPVPPQQVLQGPSPSNPAERDGNILPLPEQPAVTQSGQAGMSSVALIAPPPNRAGPPGPFGLPSDCDRDSFAISTQDACDNAVRYARAKRVRDLRDKLQKILSSPKRSHSVDPTMMPPEKWQMLLDQAAEGKKWKLLREQATEREQEQVSPAKKRRRSGSAEKIDSEMPSRCDYPGCWCNNPISYAIFTNKHR